MEDGLTSMPVHAGYNTSGLDAAKHYSMLNLIMPCLYDIYVCVCIYILVQTITEHMDGLVVLHDTMENKKSCPLVIFVFVPLSDPLDVLMSVLYRHFHLSGGILGSC